MKFDKDFGVRSCGIPDARPVTHTTPSPMDQPSNRYGGAIASLGSASVIHAAATKFQRKRHDEVERLKQDT